MPVTFREMLAGGPLLADGAWGTQLQARGLGLGECPDHWNLSHPDAVRAVAESYVRAGSRVILTNTFRASPIPLRDYGLAGHMAAINAAGVRHSREAALETGALVFASIGPSGKMLPAGEVTGEDLADNFAAQCEALAEAGPDALLLETMSDLDEARVALAAAKRTGLPVIVSFAFDTGKRRDRTMTGATPEQVVTAMEEAGADAVGANCGNGVEAFPAICERMRAVTGLPLWMKANAGMPEIVDGEAVYRTTPQEFVSYLPALLAAGADFVGGCCGTSPVFIETMRREWPHAIPADRL